MIYLSDSVPMALKLCAMKRFEANEFHIIRIYAYSVLILMLDGVLRFYEDGNLVTLTPGEYYIQRAGLLQEGLNARRQDREYHDPPPVYFFMEFQGGEYSETRLGLPIRGSFQPAAVMPIISACEAACTDRRCTNTFLMDSYMYRVLSELYVNIPDGKQVSNLLSMVKKHIDSEYSSISNVQDIAHRFGYNVDHLTKLFIRKYRVSLYQYLKNVRMDHAMWLLQNTGMSLSQIARSVGYDNYSSFYRMFVGTYRTSPRSVSRGPDRK